MENEKRRSRRIPVYIELEISSLFKQDNVRVEMGSAPIEVTDISRTGIGFISSNTLQLDYYFNAKLCLGDSDAALYCVVRILRIQKVDEKNTKYGCEFVGFPPILNYIIDEYEEKYFAGIKED